MNAKRLMMALLVALLISGLLTFWLSRRLAKAAHVAAPQKQLYGGREARRWKRANC